MRIFLVRHDGDGADGVGRAGGVAGAEFFELDCEALFVAGQGGLEVGEVEGVGRVGVEAVGV